MICCILGQRTQAADSVCSIIAVTSQNIAWPQFRAAATEAKHERELAGTRASISGRVTVVLFSVARFYSSHISLQWNTKPSVTASQQKRCCIWSPWHQGNGKRSCGSAINSLWFQAEETAHSKIIFASAVCIERLVFSRNYLIALGGNIRAILSA